MGPEMDMWSPERELRLLEEMAETEAKSFDLDLGLPSPSASGHGEPAWVAYWHLPMNGAKARSPHRAGRGR